MKFDIEVENLPKLSPPPPLPLTSQNNSTTTRTRTRGNALRLPSIPIITFVPKKRPYLNYDARLLLPLRTKPLETIQQASNWLTNELPHSRPCRIRGSPQNRKLTARIQNRLPNYRHGTVSSVIYSSPATNSPRTYRYQAHKGRGPANNIKARCLLEYRDNEHLPPSKLLTAQPHPKTIPTTDLRGYQAIINSLRTARARTTTHTTFCSTQGSFYTLAAAIEPRTGPQEAKKYPMFAS